MEQSKIEMFVLQYNKHFTAEDMLVVRQRMEHMPDEAFVQLLALPFKKPNTTLLLAWAGGVFGFDAFYLGNNAFGIAKLLFYVAYLVGYFTIITDDVHSDAAAVVGWGIVAVALIGLYIYSIIYASKWTREYNFRLFTETAERL